MAKYFIYLVLIFIGFSACKKEVTVTCIGVYNGVVDKEIREGDGTVDTTIYTSYPLSIQLYERPDDEIELIVNSRKRVLCLTEENNKYYKYESNSYCSSSSVSSGMTTGVDSNRETIFLHKEQDSLYYNQVTQNIQGLYSPTFYNTNLQFKGVKTN